MKIFTTKNYIKFQKIINYPLAILFVIFQRLLSPLVLIRTTYFNADRIGILYRYYWLGCQENRGKGRRLIFDLFMASENVANHFWLLKFKEKFTIINYNHFLARVLYLNQKLPNPKKYLMPNLTHMDLMVNAKIAKNITDKKQPYLSLSNAEIAEGQKILKQMGVPENTPFICFHNRDTAYLDTTFPDKSSTYHNYRDSSISNYLEAAAYMTTKGCYAIRVGAFVKEKVEHQSEKIIDYSSSPFRNEFMDVFLGSQCKLFICSDVGIAIIPELFDVPTVYANVVPLANVSVWIKRGLYIPKRFYSKKLKRDLTFQEVFADQGYTLRPETGYFVKNEIELIENTPKEILETVQEMLARLDGSWVETEEMKRLQKKYWSLVPFIQYRSENYTISSTYLMANKHLLDN